MGLSHSPLCLYTSFPFHSCWSIPFYGILAMAWIGKKLLFSYGQACEGQLHCHFRFQLRRVSDLMI